MGKSGYTLRKAEIQGSSSIDILEGSNGILVAEFGPSTYDSNIACMDNSYFNSKRHPRLKFRPATSNESLQITAENINREEEKIYHLDAWLQVGRIARTDDGVYLNTQGTESEAELLEYRDGAEKVNGIWLPREGSVAFVPYETFVTDRQEAGVFIESGLARGLELTRANKASNLEIIASEDKYQKGVSVWGFRQTRESEALHKVVGFYFNGVDTLIVDGDFLSSAKNGYTFGVTKETPTIAG